MVRRQFLIPAVSLVLLSGNSLFPQEPPQTPPKNPPPGQPGASTQPPHGHHGWGLFRRPPGPIGPQGNPGDQARNWMAERALMFMLMETPPAELEKQLAGWPKFQDMSDAEKTHFRNRLESYRKNRRQTAMHAASQMGLQIRPEDEEVFIRDFWRGRRKIEETLFREMEPRRRELEGKFRDEIGGKYGTHQ